MYIGKVNIKVSANSFAVTFSVYICSVLPFLSLLRLFAASTVKYSFCLLKSNVLFINILLQFSEVYYIINI